MPTVRAFSLMKPPGIKLLIEPVLPRAITVARIHHHIRCDNILTIIKCVKQKTVFLMQRVPLHARHVTPPSKVDLFVTWEKPHCMGCGPCLLFGRLNKLTWPPLKYQRCLTVLGPVSWLATPFWLLKLIVLYFPSFWPLQSDDGAVFIAKAAVSWQSRYLRDLWYTLPFTAF